MFPELIKCLHSISCLKSQDLITQEVLSHTVKLRTGVYPLLDKGITYFCHKFIFSETVSHLQWFLPDFHPGGLWNRCQRQRLEAPLQQSLWFGRKEGSKRVDWLLWFVVWAWENKSNGKHLAVNGLSSTAFASGVQVLPFLPQHSKLLSESNFEFGGFYISTLLLNLNLKTFWQVRAVFTSLFPTVLFMWRV